jgi:predicted transcriptional regulator
MNGHDRDLHDHVGPETVSHFMTPGALMISDAATVADAAAAVDRHGVRSILVIDAEVGVPMGWATAEALSDGLVAGEGAVSVLTAIAEEVVSIAPSDLTDEARDHLQRTGAKRLLVRRRPNAAPDGVVSEIDLATGARQ